MVTLGSGAVTGPYQTLRGLKSMGNGFLGASKAIAGAVQLDPFSVLGGAWQTKDILTGAVDVGQGGLKTLAAVAPVAMGLMGLNAVGSWRRNANIVKRRNE